MICDLVWKHPADDPETQLRIRPLREQWEARGPGLLKYVTAQLAWIEFPERPTVRLIRPQKGGHGRIVSTNEIEFEAVLANPFPNLPEVVRLGWLVSCLTFGDERRMSIAMIPPVLAAAQHVELATFDEATCDFALRHWFDHTPDVKLGRDLFTWWLEVGNALQDRQEWIGAITNHESCSTSNGTDRNRSN